MTRTTIISFSLAVACALYSSVDQLPAALVAQYDFEGNVNDTTAAFNGTFSGGTAAYGAGRVGGQAIDLDGVDDYVNTTTNSNLGLTGSFSVLGWVNADVLTTGGCCGHDYTVLGNDAPNVNNEQLHLVVRSQQQHYGFYGDDLGPNGSVSTGQWYHLAWTYDATSNEQRMYLNGAANGTRTAGNDLVNGVKNALIGRWNGGSLWNGRIDQLKIYDNTLNATEVNAQANFSFGTADAWTGTFEGGKDNGARVRTVNGAANAVNNITDGNTLLVNGSLPGDGRGLYSQINIGPGAGGTFSGGEAGFPGGTNTEDFGFEATGLLNIPTAGYYVLGVNSDDGFRLQLGKTLRDVSEVPGLTGASDTRKTVFFEAPGTYPYRLAMFERGGGEFVELYAKSGSDDSSNTGMQLVGNTGSGGLETIASGRMLTKTVNSGGAINNIADAVSVLTGSGITGYHGVVNFADPQGDGGGGNFGGNIAFDNDTGIDDERFAVEASGYLWITEAATYTFGVNSDDGFRLLINGTNVAQFDANRGAADTFGSLALGVGFHKFNLVFWDNTSGGEVEFFAAKGTFSSFGAAPFRLVGDVGNGGIAVFIPEPSSFVLFGMATSTMVVRRCRRRSSSSLSVST